MKHPFIPDRYYNFFLRGYYDGDGCLYYNRKGKNNKKTYRVRTIFTSGSDKFLNSLSIKLKQEIKVPPTRIYYNSGAYRLIYRKKSSLNILNYIYNNLHKAPYLERKYEKYKNLTD